MHDHDANWRRIGDPDFPSNRPVWHPVLVCVPSVAMKKGTGSARSARVYVVGAGTKGKRKVYYMVRTLYELRCDVGAVVSVVEQSAKALLEVLGYHLQDPTPFP